MNDRKRLTLGLLVALSVALPAAVCGADGHGGKSSAGANDSAAEAVRLAQLAGELAQRAANLAAASEHSSAASLANETADSPAGADDVDSSLPWRRCAKQAGAEIRFNDGKSTSDVEISDSAPGTPAGEPATKAAANGEPAASSAADDGQRNAAAHKDELVELVASSFNETGVVPASDAAYPESLPAGSEYCDPASYSMGSSCGGCGSCRSLIWTAGAEATFLYPDLNSDGVSFEVEDVTNPWDYTFYSAETDSLYISPRVWLGVQGCRWGANLRYWHLQAGEAAFDGFVDADDDQQWGIPDAGYFANSWMEAYTIDFELTRRFCLHDTWMQFSMGVRHAEFDASEAVTGIAEVTDGIVFGYARANRLSRGTGLVFGLYGRKPLFPCSCVHLFWNGRLSWLWGPTETYAETHASIQAGDANAGSVNGAYTAVDDDLFIGEIQLGLEWDYSLRCLPANAFFRFAVEYQRWDLGMGYSTATSFAGYGDPDDTTLATATARANAPGLDLIGISLGAGLTW